MTLYEKYIKGLIEIKDLTQAQFNALMIEWYDDYKSRNGEMSFSEWLQYQEDYVL